MPGATAFFVGGGVIYSLKGRSILLDLSDEELFAMGVSIQGLMIHFRNSLGIIRLVRGNPAYPEDLAKVIQHHIDFSLRGLGVPEAFSQARN